MHSNGITAKLVPPGYKTASLKETSF